MDIKVNQFSNENLENEIINQAHIDTEEENDLKEHTMFEFEAIKKSLKTKEDELIKWHKQLVDEKRKLEAEWVRVRQEQAKIETRQKNAEDDLKLRISMEYTKEKLKISDEQSKMRENFINELENKRKDFERSREKAFAELEQELKISRANIRNEIDKAKQTQQDELKKKREEVELELQKQRSEQKQILKIQREKQLQILETEMIERRSELSRWEEVLSTQQIRIRAESDRVEKLEKALEKREDDLIDQQRLLDRRKRRLEREESRIEEESDNLSDMVTQKIEDTIKDFNQKIQIKDKEIESLREQLGTTYRQINLVKSFKEAYGEDPQVLIQSIKQLEESNKSLRDKLSNSSDKFEMDNLVIAYRESKTMVQRLQEENRHLSDSHSRFTMLEAQFRALDSEHKSLKATCDSLENQLQIKNQELMRLSTPPGMVADRDARIAAIMSGSLDDKKDLIGTGDGVDSRFNKKDEIEWLEDIWSKCTKYGIKFNRRILYAFHTALKINEWSTITILAGVSGTGKSELPRLYSEFGGLNFCSVAVQPSWDSQESMLGFFNSIDNKFEPEELLKFLVQCTTDSRYSDYMSIILLDEMNLAHVEHYFAEFLSKLESRRGLSKKYLPEIEVKLGAGVKPYGLKLSRTLLWTGTMNQDETTKSLSDKVLDRGIIINFPRPKKLESRSKMGLITSFIDNNRAKLHKETWLSWTSYEIEFSEEQNKEIDKYRMIVQEINNALEEVGRALGHRVWQSIEYYISNYPTVRQALNYEQSIDQQGRVKWTPTNSELTEELRESMKTAFEDQIVQKIMPKLRGIETRDRRGKSSLDKIEDLLVSYDLANLQEDFKIAREQGYGQFMWNSAKYLEDKNK